MTAATGFEALLDEGLALDVEARWGAGFLAGRYQPGEPPWSWADTVRPRLDQATSALDMGTGDGAVLASLAPLPALTVAQEEWLPTVATAAEALRPLDVGLVVALGSAENTVSDADRSTRPGLPFRAAAFDVVLNRHEAFDPEEVYRVLAPGGMFLTQQVGHDEGASVRALLGLDTSGRRWALDEALRQVRAAGFTVLEAHEARPACWFTDVGAFVAYLRAVPWEVPEFDVERLRPVLKHLDARCFVDGGVAAVSHRFLVVAQRSIH